MWLISVMPLNGSNHTVFICCSQITNAVHAVSSILKTLIKPSCKGHPRHIPVPLLDCEMSVKICSLSACWVICSSVSVVRENEGKEFRLTSNPSADLRLDNLCVHEMSSSKLHIEIHTIKHRHTQIHTHIFIIDAAVIVSLFSLC